MTRRNDKRNNRRNRQRNNTQELTPFAQMLMGALLGKGAEMITEALKKKSEEKTEDKPHTAIRQSGNLLESSCIINGDGSATEIPIPDGYQIFISEDGKPMIRKKIEEDENKAPDDKEGNPITYDDICKKLFCNNNIYWAYKDGVDSYMASPSNYKDVDNCTSEAQVKRLIAFNKLQNIAKYLNDGWKPKFNYNEKNWYIVKEKEDFVPRYNHLENGGNVYFKNKDLINEAIRLMGKDSLNDFFSTDW